MGNCWATRVKAESPTHCSPRNAGLAAKAKHDSQNGSGSGRSHGAALNDGDHLRRSTSSNLRAFTFSDLRAATRNFRPDSVLGEGGFGCVFKGWIDEQGFTATRPGTGKVIAVKKLNLEGLQGHKEWLAEVHFLGQLHHANLVRLIGYCAEDDHRLLVYEFMPRGSLENHLFRRGNHNQALSWAIRIKVAVGAARGLTFLHEAERPVIYRDFKTSNILLDSVRTGSPSSNRITMASLDQVEMIFIFGNIFSKADLNHDFAFQQYNAKLSDFGLAKDGPTGDNTHVSTRVMGTYGYAAPEYVATGHLTAKSDVYSFGVVLLEILTGRRAVDKNKPGGEQNLVEWARPYLNDKRKVFRLIDPRLEGQYSMKGAHRASSLALSCLHPDAKVRPLMKDVVEFLEPLLNTREIAKYSHNSSSQDRSARSQTNGFARPLQNGTVRSQQNGVGRLQQNGLLRHHQDRSEASWRRGLVQHWHNSNGNSQCSEKNTHKPFLTNRDSDQSKRDSPLPAHQEPKAPGA